MKSQINEILSVIKELSEIPLNGKILSPEKTYHIGQIPVGISVKLEIPENVEVSKRVLKHIVEQRSVQAEEIVISIPKIISRPTRIVDNSQKRKNSFLFARINGKAKAVILEVAKSINKTQVVSAFWVDKKTYRKMVDISGRPDIPPSSTPKGEPSESEISVFQKTTTSIISQKHDKSNK